MTKSSSLVILPTPISALSEQSWVDHIRVSNKKTLTLMSQDKGSSTVSQDKGLSTLSQDKGSSTVTQDKGPSTAVMKTIIQKAKDDDSTKSTPSNSADGDDFVSVDRNRTVKSLTSIIHNSAPMMMMMMGQKSETLNTTPTLDRSTHNPHFRVRTAPGKIGLLHPSLCARTTVQYADFEPFLPHEQRYQASMNVPFSMDQLKTTQGELYVPIVDRYAQRRAQVTDWTRVGVGGPDGVCPRSGLYGDSTSRFITTEHESFGRRDGGVGARDKAARHQLRLAKQQVTLEAVSGLAQVCHDATQAAKCRDFGRVNAKSSQKLRYMVAICAEEAKSLESVHMSKRSAELASSRMWRGSEHNQFNYLNRSVSSPDFGVSLS